MRLAGKLHETNAVQNVFVTLELNCRGARTQTERLTHTDTHTRIAVTDTHIYTHSQTLLQSRSTKQIHSAQRQQQSSLSVSVSVILSHISAISASQFADFGVHLFRFSGFFSRCGLQIVVSTWLQLDMLLPLPCTLHNSLPFVFWPSLRT